MTEFNVTFTDDYTTTRGQFHKIPLYSATERKHFWVVIMAYQVDPREPLVLLTKDSLVSLQKPFCYHCDTAFDDFIVRRPCGGRPLEKI